jgi:hypothetical protein
MNMPEAERIQGVVRVGIGEGRECGDFLGDDTVVYYAHLKDRAPDCTLEAIACGCRVEFTISSKDHRAVDWGLSSSRL